MTKTIICLLVIFLVSAGYIGNGLAVEYKSNRHMLVSLDTAGLSFEKIVSKIASQTQYNVVNGCDSPVFIQGVFSDISVDDFFRRILKLENVAVLVDENRKTIEVSCLGKHISSTKSMVSVKGSARGSDNEFLSDIKTNSMRETIVDWRHDDNWSGSSENNAVIDQLTGLPWGEAEKKMGLIVDVPAKKIENAELATERKKRIKEIEQEEIRNNLQNEQSVVKKNQQRKDHGILSLIDSQTGLRWEEAEKAMGLAK